MKNKSGSKLYMIIFLVVIVTLGIGVGYKRNLATQVLKVSDEKKYVYPLGNLVGIKAKTDGALVIGYEEDDIQYIGGLQIGDNIVEVEDKRINSSQDITKMLNNLKKKEIKVTFERDGEYKTDTVQTKYENGTYRLGLWARDKISGIGTMTFYDPFQSGFRAIGHSITDSETEKLLKIKEGKIYNPASVEIKRSSNNLVGKIKADFEESECIGNFKDNNTFGISGSFNSERREGLSLVEVGKFEDIKLGKAIILFEDKNRNITAYNIRIKSMEKDKSSNKNMIIEVVDEKLLEYTGGIVQGMSGAPIIQNNKIIGAITHVFKNNPKKGYGIYIGEMIE